MPVLCWIDADVRVAPDAIRAAHDFLITSGAQCASGFPREQTQTFLEWMLLPLIQFVLLGYLPLALMRATRFPAFAAGCGQFMLAQRDAYFAVTDTLPSPPPATTASVCPASFVAPDLRRTSSTPLRLLPAACMRAQRRPGTGS